MKILVPVKRVIDHKSKIRINADLGEVMTENTRMTLNPFCENALEEALRLKEKGIAREVVAVTIGSEKSQDVLRTALAMGADKAILITTHAAAELQPLAIAKLLHRIAQREKPDLIITGKQSIDGDNNQTGQMLAALLGWAQAVFVTKIEEINKHSLTVTCEVENGSETLKFKMPCLITADLDLNEPRYASLPNIIKAKSKPLEILLAKDMGIDLAPKTKVLKVTEPKKHRKQVMLESVEALVSALKNKERLVQ